MTIETEDVVAELLSLAERCEQATMLTSSVAGPNRALEIDIHDALFGRESYNCGGDGQRGIPNYLRSLDAAMTLVPEGALFDVGHFGDEKPGIFLSSVMPAQGASRSSEAATPALALCAAALRARTQNTPDSEKDG